ncbi:hypothetical protein DFJ73DRAFT_217514 [Zopfochytrium polystomum]|nr:hypothetical protein DFJ73DRAFT_217514 [Zopfochytrium polystomum]
MTSKETATSVSWSSPSLSTKQNVTASSSTPSQLRRRRRARGTRTTTTTTTATTATTTATVRPTQPPPPLPPSLLAPSFRCASRGGPSPPPAAPPCPYGFCNALPPRCPPPRPRLEGACGVATPRSGLSPRGREEPAALARKQWVDIVKERKRRGFFNYPLQHTRARPFSRPGFTGIFLVSPFFAYLHLFDTLSSLNPIPCPVYGPAPPFADAPLHVLFAFSPTFPLEPPAVRLFTPLPHPNVLRVPAAATSPHGAGRFAVCLDMLRTEHYAGGDSENAGGDDEAAAEEAAAAAAGNSLLDIAGWSPTYTVRAVLMQLQEFLLGPKLGATADPTRIAEAARAAAAFECPLCPHRGSSTAVAGARALYFRF